MNDVQYAGGTVINGTRDFTNQAWLYAQEWGPRIIGALVILLIGWLVARAVKWGVANLINRTPLARRANQPNHPPRDKSTIGAQVGDAAFWVVLLVAFFLAAQPLGLASATGPLADMLNGFGNAVPRIIGAGLILFLGYILASVAKKAVEAVITASHVERLSAHVGSTPPNDPSALPRAVGSVVLALIIIPVAIAALDTLNIAAISQPATAMLRIILDAIPHVIAAGIIITLAYYIGKFASQLITSFLGSTGVDKAIESLGLFPQSGAADPLSGTDRPSPGTTAASLTPSKLIGSGVFIAIVIFGLMEAFRQLNFAYGSRIMAEVLTLFGQVVFGAIIIAAAVAIARLISTTIKATGGAGAEFTASLTKVAIIVLGTAIGLRFMGLADDIINLAFGLILGAIAVAFALAFGLGGREQAGKVVQRLLGKAEEEANKPVSADPPKVTPTPPAVARDMDTQA
ncbi:mechanosensitive ion channel [Sphingomonas sp. DC2300-3]|uniref:mechanosensitive ion channel n=1 Tax=unclassified Sphingomonas TaxID=196159 RepID=UPI003CF4F030